ncbi:DUF1003 domain-containing protein [Candidatus Woesearchaeota archaeon]|nr:DUF1003 domain-containing protein [Candidatus Woesearchaeota archaeon]
MNLKVGEPSQEARIYKCSRCNNLKAFLVGEQAVPCELCAKEGKLNTWVKTTKRIITISKNIATEFEKQRTVSQKISDWITAFCGSMPFVYIHMIWFGLWILLNIAMFAFVGIFDPYPYGLLTMIVSLEAIVLSTFILITQNRQSEKADMRAEMDYRINLKAEKEIAEILERLKELHGHVRETPKKKKK